jgi:hypothetical protein
MRAQARTESARAAVAAFKALGALIPKFRVRLRERTDKEIATASSRKTPLQSKPILAS